LQQVELVFQTGQVILVYGDMDEDGFYMGELDGIRGLVPSNFLADADQHQAGVAGATPQNAAQRSLNNRGRPGIMTTGPGARGPPPPPRDNMMMGGMNQRKGTFFRYFMLNVYVTKWTIRIKILSRQTWNSIEIEFGVSEMLIT